MLKEKRDQIASEMDALQENGFQTEDDYRRWQALRNEYRDSIYDERIDEGDIGAALCLLGSEEVAAAIVRLAPGLSDDQLREILREEWTRCEAHRPVRMEMVGLFRRVGFITDAPGALLPHTREG